MSAALKIAAVAGLLALQTPAWADDGRWVFSTGVDYSTGDYGETQDTTIVTVPVAVGYLGDRWSATLTVPLVSIDGPGTVVPGGIGGGSGGGGLLGGLLNGLLGGEATNDTAPAPVGGVNETGLGDMSFEISAVPYVSDGGTQFSVAGRVRAPTADAGRSLGTGEAAAAVSAGLREPIGARAALFGTVGYEQAFDDGGSGLFASVGAQSYVSDSVLTGVTFAFTQASSELHRDAAQAGAYLGFDLSKDTRLVAYGAAGLSDTSPDLQAGLRLTFAD